MALLSEAIRNKEYDVRMIQRSLNKGLMRYDDVEKMQKTLDDDTASSDYVNLETLAEGLGGKSGLRD